MSGKRKKSTRRRRSGQAPRPLPSVHMPSLGAIEVMQNLGLDLWDAMQAEARRAQFPNTTHTDQKENES